MLLIDHNLAIIRTRRGDGHFGIIGNKLFHKIVFRLNVNGTESRIEAVLLFNIC